MRVTVVGGPPRESRIDHFYRDTFPGKFTATVLGIRAGRGGGIGGGCFSLGLLGQPSFMTIAMKFSSSDFDLSQLVISSEQLQPRVEGLHVSGIIRHIKEQLGLQKGDFDDDDLNQFAAIGRLWERILADCYFPEPRYVRPGECVRDNIWGSPDCVDMEEWQLAEFKCTWVSSKHGIDSDRFQHYIWQVKSYCYILGMVRARIIVLHLCGDWRTSPVPVARDYELHFSEQELLDNWIMMVENARTM